ncbi:hypothetical protein Syun_019697 [Stephania yunnanensis]|uniref:NADH:quinone oxidoreductase/Mrp antiporter transmembrane domain-containing protein n=1 Tax=Stephania yunnanensis TaxID=152371 RepID=A0AAP0NY77_9MAGN
MEGPTPISALIHAATMVAAGIFLVARLFPLFTSIPYTLNLISLVGIITVLLGATLALAQRDIKRSKGKGPSPLFGPIVGEEGFEPPTPWFVATCSNPLSYRPHPVSTGSVPGSTPKRNLSSPQPFSGLRRCESAFLSIRTVPSEV